MKLQYGLHHRVDWRIAGKTSRNVGAEGWEWPSPEEALDTSRICNMKEYVRKCQGTIEDYISMRPL